MSFLVLIQFEQQGTRDFTNHSGSQLQNTFWKI